MQHGSYPVFSGDGTPLPPFYYLERTSPSNLTVSSEFQPDGSVVHAVYNPQPGSWFAVAYLESYEEPHGLSRKCRWVRKMKEIIKLRFFSPHCNHIAHWYHHISIIRVCKS